MKSIGNIQLLKLMERSINIIDFLLALPTGCCVFSKNNSRNHSEIQTARDIRLFVDNITVVGANKEDHHRNLNALLTAAAKK